MSYYVYENWIRDKAIVHRSDCSFCNNGRGLHGTRTTKSSTWHGPFDNAALALAKARSYNRQRTDVCEKCDPL